MTLNNEAQLEMFPEEKVNGVVTNNTVVPLTDMRSEVIMVTTLKEKFDAWDSANPQVYNLFCKFTLQAAKAGHNRLSAWMIVNRIRWETAVVTSGNDYKVSNDFIAFYARKFMEDYPEYEGFFATKNMKR